MPTQTDNWRGVRDAEDAVFYGDDMKRFARDMNFKFDDEPGEKQIAFRK